MAANRRSYVGRVVSAKMQNTLVVAVDRVRHHAVYGKALRRKTVLYVHDPLGESQYGDLVRVIECRPVSKTKRFRLQAVLQRHEVLRPEEFAEAEAVMAEAVETGELLVAIAVAEEAAGSEADVEETVAGMGEVTDDSVDEEAETELDGGAPVAEAEAAEEQEAATEEPEASVAEAIEHEAPVAEAPSEESAAEEADEPTGTEEAEAEAPAGEAEAAAEEPQAAEEAESPTAEAPPEEADAIVEEAEAPAEEAALEATDAAEEASSEDGETPRKEDA